MLGPVEVEADGEVVNAGRPRQRSVLAVLAADAGKLVNSETLIDRVWGDSPPQRVREALYVYVSRLRAMLRELGDGQLLARTGGYLLEVKPQAVDLLRFRELTDTARSPSWSEVERRALLKEALGLWRGRPLAGVPGEWAATTGDSWRQEHLEALVSWARCELNLGNAGAVLGPLAEAIAEHPLAESPIAALMSAYRSLGRSAQALELYETVRHRLADELGTDPAPQLQEIHQAILRAEPVPVVAVADVARPLVAQLPARAGGFAGREAQLAQLRAAMPLVVVAGTAGVGKTALALQWAHSALASFPDGQLFVDLCGFDPVRKPLAPSEVLQRFLRGMGVDNAAIPREQAEMAALYRSRVAGRRMLIVLDNAHSDEQVRPLLPGSASCVVVVTSRVQLRGLITREGAGFVQLGPLPPAEAHDFLRRNLGVAYDSAAVGELARHCCYLPLALRVAAAHLTCHPHLRIGDYCAQLAASPLSILDDRHDLDAQLVVAFELSYQALDAQARRLFRLTGIVPAKEFSVAAMAAVLECTQGEAQRLIGVLCAAHLVGEVAPGRYRSHDLLNLFARLRIEVEEQSLAERRLLDFYAHTVFHAYPLLGPRRRDYPRDIQFEPVDPLVFADRAGALDWLDREKENLLGVIELANSNGWHASAWQITHDLFWYFTMRRRWPEWQTALGLGLNSAQQCGDRLAEARMHNSFGIVHEEIACYEQAGQHYTRALELAIQIGDRQLMAALRVNLGGQAVSVGDPESGLRHLREAIADPDLPQARSPVPYVNLGRAHLDLDQLSQAEEWLGQALRLAEAGDDVVNMGRARHYLAEVALLRGDRDRARVEAQAQLSLAQAISDPVQTAAAFDTLASAVVLDDPYLARKHWLAAQEIYAEFNHQLGSLMGQWLASLDSLTEPAAITEADAQRRRQTRQLWVS